MAFSLDVTVTTKNSLWPLATIVEDLDLLGGVVGPLGEPLHVLGGDLVPGHRHHLGSPRVRAVVEISDHQLHYPVKCCASPTHGTPHLMSWLFLNSMYHISVLLSRYGPQWVELEEMLWQVYLLEIACR